MSSRHSIPVQSGGLLIALLVTYAVAAIGAWGSADAGSFYRQLVRPEWAPPGWLFGPVWSLLYTLMAVSGWRVWRADSDAGKRKALGLFALQLIANALWSWLFFAWRLGAAALVEILILWLLIGATAWLFWRIDRWACVLLWPYLGWVGFAAALNASLWLRNPALLGG